MTNDPSTNVEIEVQIKTTHSLPNDCHLPVPLFTIHCRRPPPTPMSSGLTKHLPRPAGSATTPGTKSISTGVKGK